MITIHLIILKSQKISTIPLGGVYYFPNKTKKQQKNQQETMLGACPYNKIVQIAIFLQNLHCCPDYETLYHVIPMVTLMHQNPIKPCFLAFRHFPGIFEGLKICIFSPKKLSQMCDFSRIHHNYFAIISQNL